MRHVKGIVAASLVLFATAVTAQTPATNTPSSAPAAAPTPDYHPSLGDLMTMAVQPRHTKLGLAGRQGNWPYAQYELSELRNAFARVTRTIPVYRNIDMAPVFASLTMPPLSAVEQAIHAQDAGRFKAAYAQLTTACNACHLSQDHAAVVIRVPDTNPYADQDFRKSER
ncbi:MAG TPA: hypothetical protein VGV09_04805 [Steroidobacteraceae bacterium]|nr:hypothetical protein [Steroidobacteraceae bacterium]